MAEESARLRIPYIAAAQAQKHVTHNEAMTLLDTIVQLSVLDKDLTAPPGSPAEGDCYIAAAGATGAWVGWDNRIARFIDGEWRSYLPGAGSGAGWRAYVIDEAALYIFDGSAWVAFSGGGGIVDGDKGDITVSSSGANWTIDNDAVTFAKMQNIATDSLIGRDTASSGDPENITLNATLSMTGAGALQRAALTGDVTASAGSNATTIANDAVTNAKLANVATATFKGRITAGTGDPEDLTATQATALLNTFVGDSGAGGTKGLVPAPASGDAAAGKFLKADGTFAVPPGGGGGVSDGDKGDITVSGSSTVWTIDSDAVNFAKMQNIATDSLIGRDTAATGDPESITVGGGIEFTGAGGIRTTAFTGDVTKSAGGTALTIANLAVTTGKIATNAVDNTILRDSAALSVIGRSANSSGDPADIAAANDGEVLRRSGTSIGFGSIAATQSDQEAASETALYVTPGRQHFHPSAVKAWGKCDGTASTVNASYGVSSVTNGAAGVNSWNWSVTFSSAEYGAAIAFLGGGLGSNNRSCSVTSQTATAMTVLTERSDGFDLDPTSHFAAAFGDL